MMTANTIVFLGPSLSLAEAKTILPDAVYYPPVQCGDIIRILHLQPTTIAIIDGYFEHSAAVWHKEILLALTHNITVYGAASMGALRAAELTAFGMRGVGKIFQDFYSGHLNDDDEVAVVHRPDKSNYEAITDAMVNIRATLYRALSQEIITTSVAENLLQHTKTQFYKQRSLNKSIAWHAEQYGENNIKSLRDWLAQNNFVDQKKQDAITLLETLVGQVVAQQLPDNVVRERYAHPDLQINNTILLHKLNERCQCEPDEHSTESDDAKRYTRLLAYLLKTSERLNLSLPTEQQAQQIVQENKTVIDVFYYLFLLFDAPLWLQMNFSRKNILLAINNNHKHLKILLIASAVLFSIREILHTEEMRLNPEQITLCMNEIMQLLTKKTSLNGVEQLLLNPDIDLLTDVYSILKNTINNGADAFLTTTPALLNKPYYTLAQKLYISF